MTRHVASGKKPELPEPQFPHQQDGITTAAGLQGHREGQTGSSATRTSEAGTAAPGSGPLARMPAFFLPRALKHLHTWPQRWPLPPQGRSQTHVVPTVPALCLLSSSGPTGHSHTVTPRLPGPARF